MANENTRERDIKLARRLGEQALYWWHQLPSENDDPTADRAYAQFLVARAQLHATLAVAAQPELRAVTRSDESEG